MIYCETNNDKGKENDTDTMVQWMHKDSIDKRK